MSLGAENVWLLKYIRVFVMLKKWRSWVLTHFNSSSCDTHTYTGAYWSQHLQHVLHPQYILFLTTPVVKVVIMAYWSRQLNEWEKNVSLHSTYHTADRSQSPVSIKKYFYEYSPLSCVAAHCTCLNADLGLCYTVQQRRGFHSCYICGQQHVYHKLSLYKCM